MTSLPRRYLSVVLSASAACAGLILAAGPAGAATVSSQPTDLSVALLSPHAGNSTGANVTYTSNSGWLGTNVVLTFPGWTALNPIANTGSAPCPASISVTAKTAAGGGAPRFSECTWTQASGSAVFSVVVSSSSGLHGPVTIGLSQGMMSNPIAPASYSVSLSEQSNAGWVTLSDWTPIDVPSDFIFQPASPAPGILTPATATYVSASGWADTNVILTLPGWTAQNTFASTGSAPCPSSITVTATPSTATVSQCSWLQVNGSAIFTAVVSSPNQGLSGAVTIAFGSGSLRNPIAAAKSMARLSEQSSAGWNSMDWWVNVGVPVSLQTTLTSDVAGATSGATVTYSSGSDWAATNVSVLFQDWAAEKTFTSTGAKACPAAIRVTATPPSATTSECSWSQGSDGAHLNLVINSPGFGLQGPVRIVIAKGLLGNPDVAGPGTIRLVEQSGAGYIGLSTSVNLQASS